MTHFDVREMRSIIKSLRRSYRRHRRFYILVPWVVEDREETTPFQSLVTGSGGYRVK